MTPRAATFGVFFVNGAAVGTWAASESLRFRVKATDRDYFENPGLDFSKNRAEGDDILGDAYEYLMRHFATESGKSKGQFYTPAEVSRVIANVIGISPNNTKASTTAYDPTCGSGSLLLKVAAEAGKRAATITEQLLDLYLTDDVAGAVGRLTEIQVLFRADEPPLEALGEPPHRATASLSTAIASSYRFPFAASSPSTRSRGRATKTSSTRAGPRGCGGGLAAVNAAMASTSSVMSLLSPLLSCTQMLALR